MITKEEYKKAQQIIDDYKIQTNKALIKNHICICCKTKEIKPLEGWSLADGYVKASEQEQGSWDDGTVEKISFGYGSKHDMRCFYIAMCDDCAEQLEKDGLIIDVKTIRKEEKKYEI